MPQYHINSSDPYSTHSLPSNEIHIPNWRPGDSKHRRIMSRLRGSKMCSGHGTLGYASAHTKVGILCFDDVSTLQSNDVCLKHYSCLSSVGCIIYHL